MPDSHSAAHRVDVTTHFGDSSAPVRVSRHALSAPVGMNEHTFFLGAVLTGGAARHLTAAGPTRVEPGGGMLLRPGAWHAWEPAPACVVWNVAFRAELLESELGWLATRPATRSLLWSGPMASPAGRVRFTLGPGAMTRFVEMGEGLVDLPSSRPIAIGRLLEVLGLFADGLDDSTSSAVLHPGVAAAHRALEADPARPWSLDELAAEAHLAPSYFGRRFREAFGRSPLAYLARRRAERAAHLLATTGQPVAEVGAAVGWDDANYFSRRFGAEMGMTPTECRRRLTTPTDHD